MAKSSNQTLKLLHLHDILLQKTNDEHGLTTAETIAELERCGIHAERETIYEDYFLPKQLVIRDERI